MEASKRSTVKAVGQPQALARAPGEYITREELAAAIQEGLTKYGAAKESTLQQLKNQVGNIGQAVAELADVTSVIADDVKQIRDQNREVLKTVKKVVSGSGGWKVLLDLLLTLLIWIWTVVKFVWNFLTGASVGSLVSIFLFDLARIKYGKQDQAFEIVRYFALVVLLAVHMFRTVFKIKVYRKESKKYVGFLLPTLFDFIMLKRLIIVQNPIDGEVIRIFQGWMQGLITDINDYIVEIQVFDKVYSFVVESDAFGGVGETASTIKEAVWFAVKYPFTWLLSLISGPFCATRLGGWICGGGPENELSTLSSEIARMSAAKGASEALDRIVLLAWKITDGKQPLTPELVASTLPAFMFLFALDNVYTKRIDKLLT